MKSIVVFVALFYCATVFGQKDKGKTLFFGVNVGTKIANKNYAFRYSGIYNHFGTNETQLEYYLNLPQNYEQIRQKLNGVDFKVPYDAYSLTMNYTPGLLTGVTLGYQISPNLQISADANINRLKVKNVFSIQTLDGSVQTSQEQYRLGQIYAEESRFDGRFNMDYVFDGTGKAKFIMGISGLFTAWRIDQHVAIFEGVQFPMFSQFSGVPASETNINRGRGWGLGLNFGVEYQLNQKIVSQIMYQPYHTFVDYGVTIQKRFLPQHDIVVRFLWK